MGGSCNNGFHVVNDKKIRPVRSLICNFFNETTSMRFKKKYKSACTKEASREQAKCYIHARNETTSKESDNAIIL
jgi:hypothetical protein